MRTSPATAERYVKVALGEMADEDAQRELSFLSFEDWFRFEQLMGNTSRIEPTFRVFTWAMDWAFSEEANDDEIPLPVQMRMWEEDELRKMQEEGIRSLFTQWRTRKEEELEEGLNLGRLYEELRRLSRDRHTRVDQDQEQVGREWQPDEWIRTSVWILEEIGGGHQEGVANLPSVGLRIYPSVYTA
jgi:hypothetical protein